MVKNVKFIFLGLILLNLGFNLNAQVTVDVLVVAGGGGGGHRHGGGGGAGGLKLVNGQSITNGQNYTITVGSGGAGSSGASTGGKGGNSSFGTLITSEGGGGGGSNASNGASGGSGGGGSNGTIGGNGVTGEGNKGGNQNNGNGCCFGYGTGGGGAGAAGQNTTGSAGSNGGIGSQLTITGSSVYYSGGGGGGHLDNSLSSYLGGLGGGGNGGNSTTLAGSNGTANTGGGGGGGGATNSTSGNGGSGGSGIVIVRYVSSVDLADGGFESSYTSGGVTYRVHTFISSGTFTYNGVIITHPSTSSQSVCVNGTLSSSMSVTANGSSPDYQWYSNVNNSNSGGTLISGAQSASYTPPTNVAGTRYYYCYVTSILNSVRVNQTSNVSGAVNVGTVAGTISGANTVNSGTNSTTLTLSGHTGTIQWQSYTGSNAFGNATGTSTNVTYTATNLTATTYYRAVVTNGSCGSLNTASATILVLPSTTPSSTSMSITGTSATNAMTSNVQTVVDDAIVVSSGNSGNISGFTVSISENYTAGDVLGYTGTLPTGVTATAFSTTSRSLVFRGNASASQWQALLRTVTLQSTSGTCNPVQRKVTFSVSTNFYNFFNGHYYEYVSSGRVWSSAKSNAESKTFFGRQGYLATINSAEENAYISKLIGQNSWLGATDNYLEINKAVGYTKYTSQSQAEGKYHWVTGPEKGVQISNGSSSVPGRYLRWAGGEPNNFNTGFRDRSLNLFGEHYLHIYSSSSTWNDFPDDRSLGSIIEYGDMPGDNPITGIEFTRNITISGMMGVTVTGGLGNVCSGTNSTTLTLTSVPSPWTVSRWESSDDNFLSNVTTINNTTTSLTATNLTEKTFYRAVMANGGCILPTPSTFINVLELDGGVISAESNEGCAGSAINLTLGGHKGTVTRWEITTNPVGSITNISSTSTSLSHTISAAGSYFMRAVVGNSSCSNSTQTEWYPVVIASAGAPTAGEVSSAAHCGSANNGTLTLKGSQGGSSYQWQQSTNGGSTWSDMTGEVKTRLTYNNISQNTQYRVQVTKGSCGSATSSVGEIIIYGTTISQWTGGGSDNNWSTAANWCGEVIGTTGRRVAISEDALREPTLDANLSLAELNFNASGKKITLGTWNAEVQSILGADSLNYFKTTGTGSLVKNIANTDSFKFAVGLSNYNPVTIVNKTGTADQFSVYVFDEVYEGGSKGNGSAMSNKARIQATWEIGKTSGSANAGSGVDFVFEWENSKRRGNIINPTLNHYNASRNEWEFASNTSISRGRNNLRLIGYKGTFSPFAIGDGMTPLPVDIISFTAEGKANAVQLNWVTESEVNHSHFVVMRSKDGKEWEEIGVVANKTNSQGINQYELIDTKPYSDNYYQLKVVDNEGNSELSDIRFVQLSIAKPLFVLSPNPTSGVVKIQTESQDADYSVYDISGKVLHQGILNKEIELNNLSSGIYFIKVMVEDRVEVKKLIVE